MAKGDEAKRVIGLDLGATKILGGVVTPKGNIVGKAKLSTPVADGPQVVIDAMAEVARRAAARADMRLSDALAVGVGSPGPLQPETGLVYHAPNLGWKDVPLGQRLSDALGLPVFVYNDVDSGTYGEFKAGAGRGVSDLVGIFPGSGIGGGIILDGKLRTGFRGAAGEVGHMIIVAGGPVCGCGKHGCAEAVASRLAIERDIRLAVENGRKSVITEMVDVDRDRITSGMLARALEQNDRLVMEIMHRAASLLGILAADVVNLIDVERVVFGGGLIEACGHWMMPYIRDSAYEHFVNKRDMHQVQLVEAELGDFAGVVGAAMLARVQMRKE